MDIQICYGSLYNIVSRSLSIIGKRSTDDNGNKIFADITLGSREKDIVCDFFGNAFVTLCAELNKFISAQIEQHSSISSIIYTKYWTDQEPETFYDQVKDSGEYLYSYAENKLYVSEVTPPNPEDPESERTVAFIEVPIVSGMAIADPQGNIYKVTGSVLISVPSGIDDSVTLSLTMPDNWNDALLLSLRQAVNNYCVAYALYSWFSITARGLAEKYTGDMARNLTAIISLIHDKNAPADTSVSYADVTGEIVPDNT